MRSFAAVVSGSFLAATNLTGCAGLQTIETKSLKCGDVQDTKYSIPTTRSPYILDIQFKLACDAGHKGVEISMKNHPWGGVGKTMGNIVGRDAPNYEYIPCANTSDLKAKWDNMDEYDHFANLGRDISDINNVQIDMRFREDYRLRYYMLTSAKNICSAAL